jgi:C1A family cysteine protease
MNKKNRSWAMTLALLLAGTSAALAQEQSLTVSALNSQIQSANGGWTAGETSMSKLSEDEFRARLISPDDLKDSVKRAGSLRKLPLTVGNDALGPSLDWRQKGVETPVRDQGKCGSCWAFSMSGAEELQLILKKPEVYSKPGAEVQRAVQALVSCDTKMKGCNGGSLSADYLVASGLPAESLYPYVSGDGSSRSCGDGAAEKDWKDKTEKISDWGMVDSGADAMKAALAQYGPLPTSMMVFDDFKYYKSGVYSQTAGSKYLGGHAILIVGYDDADQSFLVKNSWGADWGLKGYFKIGYSQVACSLWDMLFGHKHVNFGCPTIAYNMKSGGKVSAEAAPVMSPDSTKGALDLLSTPLP